MSKPYLAGCPYIAYLYLAFDSIIHHVTRLTLWTFGRVPSRLRSLEVCTIWCNRTDGICTAIHMQYNIRHAIYNIHYTICNIQHQIHYIKYATSNMQYIQHQIPNSVVSLIFLGIKFLLFTINPCFVAI